MIAAVITVTLTRLMSDSQVPRRVGHNHRRRLGLEVAPAGYIARFITKLERENQASGTEGGEKADGPRVGLGQGS